MGTATGRLTSSQPALHNFAKKVPDRAWMVLKDELALSDDKLMERYCLRNLVLKGKGIFQMDFMTQENRAAAYACGDEREAELFIKGIYVHTEAGKEMNVDREVAKSVSHGVRYGEGVELLAKNIESDVDTARKFKSLYWKNHPELKKLNRELMNSLNYVTPFLNREITQTKGDRRYINLNWVIQGPCAELLWVALEYLATLGDEVRIIPHYHDEIVIQCLICSEHGQKPCQPILTIKTEIEKLYPLYWPNTKERVFRLECK